MTKSWIREVWFDKKSLGAMSTNTRINEKQLLEFATATLREFAFLRNWKMANQWIYKSTNFENSKSANRAICEYKKS